MAVALASLAGDVFEIDIERAAGLPETQKRNEHNDGGGRGDDGDEPRARYRRAMRYWVTAR